MGAQPSVDAGGPVVELRFARADFEAVLARWRGRPGVRAMVELYPDVAGTLDETLASIQAAALALLPGPTAAAPAGAHAVEGETTLALRKLVQGENDDLALDRTLVHALLAALLLEVAEGPDNEAMPGTSFAGLLDSSVDSPQEVAKLRMVLHYFERTKEGAPRGQLRISRRSRPGEARSPEDLHSAWSASERPMLPLTVMDVGIGFEDPAGRGCLHADFANMFLGGGVLSGGCVQEEIRFSICPELIAAMLVCPCMLDGEAIIIVGGEQFSTYTGYAFGLQYGGDHVDENPRDADGTVLVAIAAMDAVDYRGQDSSLQAQLSWQHVSRDLEKAAAAFAPTNAAALAQWPTLATGNWGCGAFGGCVQLKACVQWIAASEGQRHVGYFPY
eukprot:SAG31_NODE_8388_length_1460_cov_1.886848_1_plen_388_part_01